MSTHLFPEADQDANVSTGFLFWQVSTLWQRQINQALAPLELTQVRFVSLASIGWLNQQGHLPSQAELARQTRMDPMMLSTVLRQLEKDGRIERLPHPTDSRVWQLRLTTTGQQLLREAAQVVYAVDTQFFARIAPAKDTLHALLQQLGGGSSGNGE